MVALVLGWIWFYNSISLAQTYIDVKINEWYKGFYDLLQKAPKENYQNFMMEYTFYEISNSICNYLHNNKLFYTFMGIQMERSNDFFLYALLESSRLQKLKELRSVFKKTQ